MINLTTRCGNSETLLAAIALVFFVAPAISLGQSEEFSRAAKPTGSEVSVLELIDNSTGLQQQSQDDPLAIQKASVPPRVTNANEPQQLPEPIFPNAIPDADDLEEPQVLLRGQLHEAFADAHQADPQANPIVNAAPPEVIKEVPPEFKPEGSNIEWIPGYWAWDVSQDDFIWISGVWRDVPPNQRWVPGYWEQVENGHRWIAGFWTGLENQELNYLPTPPANLDRGPSVAAPSDDYFYCPGNWEYQNDTYVWRTGHWQPRVANWIWIPTRYIWTPSGCIYRPGYWDREFDVRGTLFAPVYFPQQQYLSAGYRFRPNHCVNTGADFFVHLFVQPNCNHYFYGNWYGQNFVNTGFRPWVQPQSHFRNYDPLLAHYNCSRYRQGTQLLISWVNNQHRHYHRNHDHRPRNTFQSHVSFAKSNRDHRHHDFISRANLANRYDDIVRGRGKGKDAHSHNSRNQRNDNSNLKRKYVRTDRHDHDQHDINERLQREIRNTRKSGEQRFRDSVRNDKNNPRTQDQKNKQIANRNAKDPRTKDDPRRKQNPDPQRPGNSGKQDIARRKKIDLPKTRTPNPNTRNDRVKTTGLTRAEIEKAQRDQEKANRKRELDQKIAAAKQQAEIKRKQRETARALSDRQRQEKLAQTRQRIAQEKQARQDKRNQSSSSSNQKTVAPNQNSSAAQNAQRRLDEQRRRQQAQKQAQSNRTGSPKARVDAQQQTNRQRADLAKQQRELAKKQRDAQNQLEATRAKQAAQQKVAQARENSRQRELQRERERTAKAQADAQKRRELQARLAREKSQRDAERRAAQQRAQQKAQADAQRRAREKAQRDAQRNAADQARRAADAARKRQREQEQAARRAKRKKK